MDRERKAFIVVILTAIVLVLGIFTINSMNDLNAVESMDLYFMNESMTSIVPEKRDIKSESIDELIEKVIKELASGPTEKANNRIMPKDTKWTVDKNTTKLLVDFSQNFLTTDNAHNLLSAYAVVKSLCSVQGVSAVKITVAGGELITPNGDVLEYISDKDINLEKDRSTADTKSIKLYFADKEGMLSPEWRTVKLADTVEIGLNVVTELIKGPEIGELTATLASETGVISVEITDNTAYVNMHQSFIDKNSQAPEKERLAVYSIVNSLCELEGVVNVQFLIDGKKVSGFETVDINNVLTRDEFLVG